MLSVWRPQLIVLQPTPYCNIDCKYCYLRHRDDRRVMPYAMIDIIGEKIFSRLSSDAAPTVVWHAGEPTVVPIAWYEYAYQSLRTAAPQGTTFSIQSNGVAVSDRWIDFLLRTGTHVGLSIDGPEEFHDARRKTRSGGPTWSLAMRSLRRLQLAGLNPSVITVLHPEGILRPEEFYAFYRDSNINHVSFSIDELEGANLRSSFDDSSYKGLISRFMSEILSLAYSDGYGLYIREVERIANVLANGMECENEQVEGWQVIVVAANGDVTTFSPEFMEIKASSYNNFCFGNITNDSIEDIFHNSHFQQVRQEIEVGVDLCRQKCQYFHVCGGGAPANKMSENGNLATAETSFCRLSTQAAADALMHFLCNPKNSRKPEVVLA